MGFVKYDWGQQDIINKIKIWTKRGIDEIHAVIMIKYHKHPSTTYLDMQMFWLK